MSEHLSDKAYELLGAPLADRIEYVNHDKWIGYPRANEVLSLMEDLMNYPKVERMPSLLIVGNTNNGKTQILKRFCTRYPVDISEDDYNVIQPLVFISAPPKPDENEFIIRLLQELLVPYSKTDSVGTKRAQVMRTMEARETKMLIIDEVQHIIAGSYNAQRTFLNSIKDLSNKLKIPIVAAGIEDAFHAIQVDAQLANRFQVEVLEPWRFDTREQKRAFASLIASIEQRLPLPEPSFLYKPPFIEHLHYLSEGLIGELVTLLKKLSIDAMRNDLPKITTGRLEALNFLPPSKRKELLKRMR
ncbi:MAG: TniB family NTP-binding protein [Thiomicrospira sp.]